MGAKSDRRLKESSFKDMSFADAFESLFETASDAIYILDKRGNFVAINREAEELIGFKREDWIGKSFRKIIAAKSLPKATKGFLSVIRGKSIRLELELKTAFKKTILVEVTSKPLIINGKTVGTLGIARNITERKRMEGALRRSEEKFAKIFESASDAMIFLDRSGRILDVNRKAVQVFGGSQKELLGKHFTKVGVVSPRDTPKLLSVFARILRGKPATLGIRIVNRKGQKKFLECSSSLMRIGDKLAGIMVIARDITERKEAEEALRESEEKYRELLNGMNDTAWVIDFDCNFIDVNDVAVEVLGYSREELLSMGIFDIDSSLDPEEIRRLVKGMPADEVQIFETRHTTKDGKTIPVEISSSLVTYKGNQAILSIARDITERKQMEEKMAYERDLFNVLMDNIPDPIYFKDTKSRFIRVNRASCPGLGIKDPEEAIGMTDFDFAPEELAKQFYADDQMVMKSGKPIIGKEEVMIDKISRKWYSATKLPIKNKNNKVIGLVGISRNITKLKEAEEELKLHSDHLEELVEEKTKQLKQAERMAAIGETAAMVGHDLRNPLTGIAGATYYLKKKLGPKMDKKAREMLELVQKSIEYSNKIISDLLEYSREIRLELTETTPKSIIKDALTLIKIPKNIRTSDLTENKPKIKVDIPKMERVFVNIIKNAIEAMSKGGTLAITSKESNGNLEIAFTDTGVGMPKELVEKIWIPLFTTKANGMGLGLPICKRIVEAHGGNISVESTISKGTIFTITIPVKPKLEGGERIWVNVPESLLSTTTKA
jgi:PAS domain S-box-containing protein